jgi:hypothetical protein
MRRPCVYVYLATNRAPGGTTTSTKLGVASDIVERLRLLNGAPGSPGAERRPRHAPGAWRMLLAIVAPPSVGARALALWLATTKRKVHLRFRFGIEKIAWHMGLPYFVNFAELDADASIEQAIPAFTARLRREHAALEPEALATGIAELGAQLVRNEYALRTTTVNRLSFAPRDRPRDRYRRSTAPTPTAPSASVHKTSSPTSRATPRTRARGTNSTTTTTHLETLLADALRRP